MLALLGSEPWIRTTRLALLDHELTAALQQDFSKIGCKQDLLPDGTVPPRLLLMVCTCSRSSWVSAGRDFNLRDFYEAVQEFGGYEAASAQRKFSSIAKKLGIDTTIITNAGYLLK